MMALRENVPTIPNPTNSPSSATTKVATSADGAPALPGGTTKDPTKWASAGAATYDTTGMNIPDYPVSATGEQIKNAINQLAISNKDRGQVVGPIRQILENFASDYTKQEKHFVWTNKDNATLESWLGLLNANNVVNPTQPKSLISWKTLYQGNPGYGQTNAITTTPYSIPAQPDLTSAAQTAFAQVLGRSASPAEAADFAKKYQQLVQSYDSAKQNAQAGNSFNAPQTPIQFAQSGQTPASTALPSDPLANTGLEAPPTPTIAASNFAAQSDPTAASAQAAADGLNQFMSMLKGQ